MPSSMPVVSGCPAIPVGSATTITARIHRATIATRRLKGNTATCIPLPSAAQRPRVSALRGPDKRRGCARCVSRSAQPTGPDHRGRCGARPCSVPQRSGECETVDRRREAECLTARDRQAARHDLGSRMSCRPRARRRTLPRSREVHRRSRTAGRLPVAPSIAQGRPLKRSLTHETRSSARRRAKLRRPTIPDLVDRDHRGTGQPDSLPPPPVCCWLRSTPANRIARNRPRFCAFPCSLDPSSPTFRSIDTANAGMAA